MHPSVLAPQLTEVKQLIDTRLAEYCTVRIAGAAHMHPQYAQLWRSIETLITAGGKRFRPYMLVISYSAYADADADIEPILPAALAQELIHQAMLVHDDIIDRDTMRYGIQNVAGQYNSIYAADIETAEERAHMSLSSALLAGDVLLSDAYHFLSKADVSVDRLSQATSILSNGVFEVVGGELLDTENSFLQQTHIPAETIARYKTASYSFISPVTMGALLAGAPEQDIALLKQFSEYVGVGYQLRDDLLGVYGDEDKTGKSASSDITEGKRTYLIEQFDMLASDDQKQAFYDIFHHSNADEQALLTARELLEASGAKARVEETIELLATNAEEVLAQCSAPEAAKTIFRELVTQCLHRSV